MGRDEDFRRLYAAQFDALLGYALRRVAAPEDAADVVADTFLVAWRRYDEVPPGHAARLWLYGVARRTLANHRRGQDRRTALGARLRAELVLEVPDPAPAVVERDALTAAWRALAERDREVLELSVWEGLAPREIATVLGLSAVVVRTRLSRSRNRLRGLLEDPDHPPGHVPGPSGHVASREPMTVPEEDR